MRTNRLVQLSNLASSLAVLLAIGRRTRPYWLSYCASSAVRATGRSTLRNRSRSCQSTVQWKPTALEPRSSVMAVSMALAPNSVRTVTTAWSPSQSAETMVPPSTVRCMSSASRSISQASYTDGSSLSSSYAPRRDPAGTSSRCRRSSRIERMVPSASMTTVSRPLARVTPCSVRSMRTATPSPEVRAAGVHAGSSARYWLMTASCSRSASGFDRRRTAQASSAISARRFRSRR